ncbi:hypothetical protein GINT2_002256 [Glugoides intestinalis]
MNPATNPFSQGGQDGSQQTQQSSFLFSSNSNTGPSFPGGNAPPLNGFSASLFGSGSGPSSVSTGNQPTFENPSNTVNDNPLSQSSSQFPTQPSSQFPTQPTPLSQSSSQFPTQSTPFGQSSSQFPTQPSSQFPTQPSSQFPTQPSSQFPTQPSSQFPNQPSSQFPNQPTPFGQSSSQFPTQPTPLGQSSSQFPTQPSSQFPTQPSSQFPTQPSSQFPTQPSSQFPNQPSSQFPNQPTPFGQSSSQFPTQPTPLGQSSSQFPTQPSSQFPTQPSSQFPTQPSSQFPTQPSSQFPNQPSSQFPNQPTPFGQSSSQFPTQPTPLGQSSSQFPTQPSSQFPTQPSSQFPTQPLFNNSTVDSSKIQFESKPSQDQSSLIFSVKDNSINLYNLTLQEVIDRHTAILEINIKDFQKDAQEIFERDLALIKSKNNYIAIKKMIDEENIKLDELGQVLDYFELRLNEIEDAEIHGSARVVNDFEEITDKFYKKIEAFKDEQDEVLDLVNENYELIESIDNRLDILHQIRKFK